MRGSSFNAGIGLTIGLMPGAGSSLNLSLGGGRERADSSLINQQTSIIADERFEAYVEGHTQLDGGLIASLNGDLSLDTGTFGFSDIAERARSDMRRATVSLGLGGGGSPSLGIEGELAHTATDAVTRATIGEGEITIRDEDAQRAREEAGETREVAALNRDLDAARETLRDERAGVRFYASDSSVRELASGFAQTRANIAAAAEILSKALEALSPEDRARAEEIAENLDPEADAAAHAEKIVDEFVEEGRIPEEERDATAALIAGAIIEAASDPEAAAQLNACMAPGRRGFNLHDLLFPRAHAGAAVAGLCAAATTGALATGGAAVVTVAALAAAVLVAGTLTPTQAFGPIVERAVGADGSVVEIRGQQGESRAVMTARDANGNEVVFELVRSGDNYVLWDAFRLDGTGAVLPLTPLEAMGLTNELFGPVGGGFTEQRNDGMTVITPATEQLPLIFVTPEVQQNGFTLATPANPQRPLDLITTAPDVGWVTTWMTEGLPNFEGLWSPGKQGSSVQNALEHFQKHGAKFGARNPSEYVAKAHEFVNNPPPNSHEKTRSSSGDVVIFDPASNTMAVKTKDGLPKTMFVVAPKSDANPHGYNPSVFNSPMDYFNAQ